ncbi:oxidoreductase [Mycolicibacterium peregrinum]|uniref:oxidoreductase n=1 Tax=Mycolicibacterium peregrinum TaxID=43304 RepID=UPI003AB0A36F
MTVRLSYRPRGRGSRWTVADIGDLTGTTAVVTGANSGIGLETAAALAAAGARVMLACRNDTKAAAAIECIRERHGAAQLDLVRIDTSDVDSVRAAAADILDRTDRLDLLINNAGVAWPPYALSPQGVEIQLATNFLGHFALTGLLLNRLQAAPAARVVSLTSLAHHVGRLRLDDLALARHYRPFAAYAQSKFAMVSFTIELQRRLDKAQSPMKALTAHPGGSRTKLLDNDIPGVRQAMMRKVAQFQSAEMGALPTLRAATDADAPGGVCFGPSGWMELKGHPAVGRTSRRARDSRLAARLWLASETATGVRFALPGG